MTWDGVERRQGNLDMEKRLSRLEALFISELGGSGSKGNVNYHLERIEKMLQETTHEIKESTKRMEHIVLGDDGSTGLPSRLKQLEEAHKNHQGNIRIIWVAVVGVIINALWKVITLAFVK